MQHPPVSERDIRLDLISSSEWRVCDRRFAENDHRAVLGVITRGTKGYEAVALGEKTRVQTHVSLAAATAYIRRQQYKDKNTTDI